MNRNITRNCKHIFLAGFIALVSCSKKPVELHLETNTIGSTMRIEHIEFMGGDSALACGGDKYTSGQIFMTTNGGQTWKMVHECKDKLYHMTSVTGAFMVAVGDCTRIEKSYNRGLTWSRVDIESFWRNDRSSLRKVYFYDRSWGVAIGNQRTERGNSYFSPDEGTTWYNTHGQNALEDFWVFNTDSTYACGYGILEKITNKGKTRAPLAFKGDIFTGIWFTSNTTGYMCGYEGGIYKTTNGGATWQTQLDKSKPFMKRYHFNDIRFVDENTGYAVGEKGLMTTTTNAGNTWQLVKTGTTMCLTGMNYHQGILYIYSEKGTYFTMSLR